MASIKTILKSGIDRHINANYKLMLDRDHIEYDEWIRKKEENLPKFDMSVSYDNVNGDIDVHKISYSAKYEGVSVRIIPYSSVLELFTVKNYIEDIIIFVNGELTECAVPLIVEEFLRKSSVNVVYGDEDIIEEENGKRSTPYFKPAWSPHTFIDHFYFCNIVAIRRGAFRTFEWSMGLVGAESIYHTLLRYLFNDDRTLLTSVGRVSEILVHASDYANNYIKDAAVERLTQRVRVSGNNILSVIIPSKDNPHLLRPCIQSIVDNSPADYELDIIVVDNGSSRDNLVKISELKKEFDFTFFYNSMEFNFALMCNLGAKNAKGDVLLFLNDDVTIVNPDTLDILLKETLYNFSGAVGGKLLYPDTAKIQHAGVFNTRIGPAHKLQFQNDEETFYFGFNKTVNNVLAVTGACIMIRKNVYESVGGMNEELKVAFNDIDLCFKLCEKGYSNAVCNNTFMYHAESITRGRDTTEDAIVRLWSERDRLYESHPDFKAHDPYYSKYFITDCLDTRFVPALEYEFDAVSDIITSFDRTDDSAARDEACIQNGIEFARDVVKYTFGEEHTEVCDDDFYIQGFSYLIGSDNALYKKKLLLKNEETGDVYAASFEPCIRYDVTESCSDQINVERSGISAVIKRDALEPGKYRIGVLYEKVYSREQLKRYTNNFLISLSQ